MQVVNRNLPTGLYLCRYADRCNLFNSADTIPTQVKWLDKSVHILQKCNPCTHGGNGVCYNRFQEEGY